MYKKILLTLFLFLTLFFSVNSIDYYVATNGNDNNPGTISQPFKSIQKGADVAIAGDTVNVRGGTYTETTAANLGWDRRGVDIKNSGTPNNYITFQSYPGELAILDQQNANEGFFVMDKDYIIIRGFEIKNLYYVNKDPAGGILANYGSIGVIMEDNYLHDIEGTVSTTAAIRVEDCIHCIVRNNLIHTVRQPTNFGAGSGLGQGILSYEGRNVTIENNEIYDVENGIFHKNSKGGPLPDFYIKKNIVHDVNVGIMFSTKGTGSPPHKYQRVTQNIIYNVVADAIMAGPRISTHSDKIEIWNNYLESNGRGIYIIRFNDARIYNNIIDGDYISVYLAEDGGYTTVNEMDYNNYVNPNFRIQYSNPSIGGNFYSLSSWQSASGFDGNSYTVDPQFENAAERDYRLKSTSPLKGKGKNGVNIGPYLNNNEIIGLLPNHFTKGGTGGGNQGICEANNKCYYVSSTGSANGDGSFSNPFNTIQKGADVAVAGDIVYIRGGTYFEDEYFSSGNVGYEGIVVKNSGNINNPITFTSYNNENVIIDQQGNGPGFYVSGKNDIIIKDLTIIDVEMVGIYANSGSNRLKIYNVTINDVDQYRSATNVAGVKLDACNNCEVINSTISKIRLNGQFGNLNSAAVHSYGMTNAKIEGNTFSDVSRGIYSKGSGNGNTGIFRNNYFFDINDGVSLGGAFCSGYPYKGYLIENNIFNNVGSALNTGYLNGPCITTGNANMTFKNNIIKNANDAIDLIVMNDDIYFNNNIYSDLGNYAYKIITEDQAYIGEITGSNNNCFHSTLGYIKFWPNAYSNDYQFANTLTKWKSFSGFDSNSIEDSSSPINADFSIKSSSPCNSINNLGPTDYCLIGDNNPFCSTGSGSTGSGGSNGICEAVSGSKCLYASPNGGQFSAGTFEDPGDIEYLVPKLSRGDYLYLLDGTYTKRYTHNDHISILTTEDYQNYPGIPNRPFTFSGLQPTASSPVTIKGYPGDNVLFDGNDPNGLNLPGGGNRERPCVYIGVDNVVLDGFKIRGCFSTGILIGVDFPVENVIVRNMELYEMYYQSNGGFTYTNGGTNILIENNNFHDWIGTPIGYVKFFNSKDVTVRNNYMHGDFAKGIHYKHGEGQMGSGGYTRFYNNTIVGGSDVGIQTNQNRAEIYDNLLINTAGIRVHGEDGTSSPSFTEYVKIEHNTIIGGEILLFQGSGTNGAKETTVKNNILYDGRYRALHYGSSSQLNSGIFNLYTDNNCFYKPGGQTQFSYFGSSTPSNEVYGLSNWQNIGYGFDPNSVEANPLFANTIDYKLQSNSPCAGMGRRTDGGGIITPPQDNTNPTGPTSFTSTGKTSSTVNLAWSGANDNIAIQDFTIRYGSTSKLVSGTSNTITGLTPETTYTFTIQTRDTSGNLGPVINGPTVTTDVSGNTGGGNNPLTNECDNWQTNHPEWIWCDDFESPIVIGPTGYFEDPNSNGGDFLRTINTGVNSSYGMRAIFEPGRAQSGSLHLGFGNTPSYINSNIRSNEDFREIYYRHYIKHSDNWAGNPFKLSRSSVFTDGAWGTTAMIAHLWQGSGNYLMLDPVSCTTGSSVDCVKYNDWDNLDWSLEHKQSNFELYSPENANKWNCIETRVKLNDIGLTNGEFDLYINGVLDTEIDNLDFTSSYDGYGINILFLENFWNGGANTFEMERYWDNFVVSTDRIGCGDTGGNTGGGGNGVTVTADSTYVNNNLASVNDGDYNTAWASADNWSNDDAPDWLLFTFDTAKDISDVTVHWKYNGYYMVPQNMKVEVWNGNSYVQVGTINSADNNGVSKVSFASVNTERLRLYLGQGQGHPTYNNIIWLNEVEYSNSEPTPVCGNNLIEDGETCDDGDTDTGTCAYNTPSCSVCSSTCQTITVTGNYCGDGIIQSNEGEACDDGDTDNTNSCSNTCQIVAQGVCGDGKINNNEQCDGNNLNSKTCQNLGFEFGTLTCNSCVLNTINDCSYDNPQITISSPNNNLSYGSMSGTLILSTDEESSCRYSAGLIGFSSMTPVTTSDGFSHSKLISFSDSSSSHSYFLTCKDLYNQNTTQIVTFNIDGPPETDSPVITNIVPNNIVFDYGTTSVDIVLTTDEVSVCRYSSMSGKSYGSMEGNEFSVSNSGYSHSLLSYPTQSDTTYSFYVRCMDIYDNVNTVDKYFNFSIGSVGPEPEIEFNLTEIVSYKPLGVQPVTSTNVSVEIETKEPSICRLSKTLFDVHADYNNFGMSSLTRDGLFNKGVYDATLFDKNVNVTVYVSCIPILDTSSLNNTLGSFVFSLGNLVSTTPTDPPKGNKGNKGNGNGKGKGNNKKLDSFLVASITDECVPRYSSSLWSICTDGIQTRTVTDSNNCVEDKIENRACILTNDEIDNTLLNAKKLDIQKSETKKRTYNTQLTASYNEIFKTESKLEDETFVLVDGESGEEYLGRLVEENNGEFFYRLERIDESNLADLKFEGLVDSSVGEKVDSGFRNLFSSPVFITVVSVISILLMLGFIIYLIVYIRKIHE